MIFGGIIIGDLFSGGIRGGLGGWIFMLFGGLLNVLGSLFDGGFLGGGGWF